MGKPKNFSDLGHQRLPKKPTNFYHWLSMHISVKKYFKLLGEASPYSFLDVTSNQNSFFNPNSVTLSCTPVSCHQRLSYIPDLPPPVKLSRRAWVSLGLGWFRGDEMIPGLSPVFYDSFIVSYMM